MAIETIPWWQIQSVDTMKYSRDRARETLTNPTKYEPIIQEQVKRIAQLGATHVAIGTPYDREFWPVLKLWIEAARSNNLNIWLRGNFAGWEGWFGYPKIDEVEHKYRLREFLEKNSNFFTNNDIFSSCPECENGSIGDPRVTGRVEEFRAFILEEKSLASAIFRKNNVVVITGLNSMNGDVAKLIMDREMTREMGGVVTVDHYAKEPSEIADYIKEIANLSQGKVLLGELGAPIPDIHGVMTDSEQANWLKETLNEIAPLSEVLGVNYWTSEGASTEIFRDGKAKPASEVLTQIYKPKVINGRVYDAKDKPLVGVIVKSDGRTTTTNSNGDYKLPILDAAQEIEAKLMGYQVVKQAATKPDFRLPKEIPWWCKTNPVIRSICSFIIH